MNMYEIRSYTDDQGKLVTAKVPVDNNGQVDPTQAVRLYGTYSLPHPSGGAIRIEFEFPEGWGLEKAFTDFEIQAKADFERIQKEAEAEAKGKLWTPGQGQGKGLFVPGK